METTTTPPRSTGNLKKYINIVRELAVADFRLKYHDSALGYIWSMLNPMMMFAIYYFVFTRIFKSDIQFYPLFLLSGIISYTFFQDCTYSAMNSLGGKAGIMKKIYFPRSIIVFASSATSVFSYSINFLVLFALVFVTKGFSPLSIDSDSGNMFDTLSMGSRFSLRRCTRTSGIWGKFGTYSSL